MDLSRLTSVENLSGPQSSLSILRFSIILVISPRAFSAATGLRLSHVVPAFLPDPKQPVFSRSNGIAFDSTLQGGETSNII